MHQTQKCKCALAAPHVKPAAQSPYPGPRAALGESADLVPPRRDMPDPTLYRCLTSARVQRHSDRLTRLEYELDARAVKNAALPVGLARSQCRRTPSRQA